ncbi:serine/threonine-protein kinase [Leucobacter soli]|uniref:serine/threonine-protein kinase n=1 Tax=Leucobacter soli TaxID=2812850 RepID=UPI0036130D28
MRSSVIASSRNPGSPALGDLESELGVEIENEPDVCTDAAALPQVEGFELLRLLGRGGTARVFAAQDLRTGGMLAVKLLHAHLAESPEERSAFLREADILAALHHPGIVRWVGQQTNPRNASIAPSASTSQSSWIATDLVPGRSLGALVRDRGPLDPGDALMAVDAVLDALEAVHLAGFVHRDVTPANVMADVTPGTPLARESVRLIDFGIAGASGEPALGHDVGVLGNPLYLSPEQARGEPVTDRGDLYQVGGLLHFLLTGLPPFLRDSPLETRDAHVGAAPTQPSLLRPGLPSQLDALVLRALQKDPAHRFASAADMRAAVQRASPRIRRVSPVTAPIPRASVEDGIVTARIPLFPAPVAEVPRTAHRPVPPRPRRRGQQRRGPRRHR